eukprot:jgi/Chlat1/4897/Chrsp31S04817
MMMEEEVLLSTACFEKLSIELATQQVAATARETREIASEQDSCCQRCRLLF